MEYQGACTEALLVYAHMSRLYVLDRPAQKVTNPNYNSLTVA